MSRHRKNNSQASADVPAQQYAFYEPPYRAGGDTGALESHECLELPYGRLETSNWYLEGIRLLHTRHRYNGHHLFFKENTDDVVSLSFNLKGSCRIHHNGLTYTVLPQQHNMVYSPGTPNTFSNNDLETETFSIQFSPEVFLLSKSIEILVIQAEAFLSRAREKNEALRSRDDRERISQAERYLVSRLQDPPNLSELAREAGVNEYKLKRGFREVFGSTVFGYLARHRLALARQMLLDTGKTAAEIAFELGFSSPQHLNNAFKKEFGMAPKRFIRATSHQQKERMTQPGKRVD